MFTTTVNGSYPRLPDPPRPQHLAKALEDRQQGRIGDRELAKAMERATVEAVAEMVAAGIDVVSDGQIRWEDPFSYMFSGLHGFEVDHSDNGQSASSSFTTPCVVDRIKWIHPIVDNDYRFLAERSPVSVRPVLTGPFSLAKSCNPGIYNEDFSKLCSDIAGALNREIEGLQESGARYILVEEPLLKCLGNESPSDLRSFPNEREVFLEASEILCKGITSSVMLSTGDCDLANISGMLLESPFHGISFDLVTKPENEQLLLEPDKWQDRIIQLGVVNPFDPVIEKSIEVAILLIKIASCNNPGLLWVSPVSGLGALSRSVVFDKLSNMCQGVQWARRELARREQPGGRLPI